MESGAESRDYDNKSQSSPGIPQRTRNPPIFSHKKELIDLVRKNQFVILVGETGSGKSTQIPQYLVEAEFSNTGKVGVTQPRRGAVISLANRVAVERGGKVGESVGYAIRFEKNVSAETSIIYLTDGMLIRECASDANLNGYSVIIIDEAHERSIHTDVCFGLLKLAAQRRPDLKVIISSATTLEENKFARFFNAPVLNVSGKVHPVEIICSPTPGNEDEKLVQASPAPEITRCNLQSVVLTLIAMGIEDPMTFEFMDPPPKEVLMEAIDHLQELSALSMDLKLTPLGIRMAEFPLDPPLAKVLLESDKLGCSGDVLKIVALLSTNYQNIFVCDKNNEMAADATRARYSDVEGGDLLTYLKVYEAWIVNQQSEQWCQNEGINYLILKQADQILEQLKEILQSRGISQEPGSDVNQSCNRNHDIARAFTSGYFRKFAKLGATGHAYQVVGSTGTIEDVYLHPTSCLFSHKPPFVIYHQVVTVSKTYMKDVTPIDPQWIPEYVPQFAAKLSRFGLLI